MANGEQGAGIWDLSIDSEEAAHVALIAESGFFGELLGLGEAEMGRIGKSFAEAAAKGDAAALEHFADEGGDMQYLIEEVAELAMVAMYHWVERTLKRELGRKVPMATVKKMDYPTLAAAFAATGLDLNIIADAQLVTGTLRYFANSWKHNADAAGGPLLADLGLTGDVLGHFSNEGIRQALSAKLALAQTGTGVEIVNALAPRALGFLRGVVAVTRA
jgi:hypothetical protein